MTLYEGRHPGEFIINEDPGHRSREAIKIGASQTLEPNTVVAKKAVIADAVATPSAAAGNTGDATIAMTAPELTSKAIDGRYKGIALTATTVRWEDPSGKDLGISTHAAAFAKGGIKFTITAGATPNVAGDEFYVDVALDAADYEWVAFDQDGTDGSEVAAGIVIYGATTGVGESAKVAAIVRGAEVNGNCLVWPDDIDAAEQVNGEQALGALGIIVRN
jgi:glycerate-2-kinase